MRNLKVNRTVKVVLVGSAVGLGLSGALLLGTVKRAVCFLKGPCEGGLYQCEVNGELTCDCPPIGSNTDGSVIWLTPKF